MGLLNINELLAALDSRRKAAGQSVMGLLTDPRETLAQLGSYAGGGLTDRAQSGLLAAKAMTSSDPAVKAQGQEQMLNSLLNMGGMAGVMTYHGTPHNVSAWDLSKVGTGQGAQSYGHGIYFAENPETGKAYRDMLGGTEVRSATGEVLSKDVRGGQSTPEGVAREWLNLTGGDIGKALELLNRNGKGPVGKLDAGAANVLETWRAAGAQVLPGGKLYKQNLPDEMLPKMLQWDKPLSEQPHVLKALDKLGVRLPVGNIDPIMGSDLILRNLMSGISDANGVVLGKHQALASKGIPGLSYYDAGSRAAGQGTMNHVIWDQGLLDRMKPEVMP